MMKKIISISSILAAGMMMTEATAQPLVCPFTDHFTVSAPSGYVIQNLITDGNITGVIKDEFHFNTSCKSDSTTGSGHAYLTLGNGNTTCYLTILDGPFENNPSVISVSCNGDARYAGMDHVKGSYSYTLKFV